MMNGFTFISIWNYISQLIKPILRNRYFKKIDWLIDKRQASSIPAVFMTRTSSKIYFKKAFKNERRDRLTGSTTCYRHCKSMECWIGTNNLIFISGYNMSTLLWNQQKGYLSCRECDTPQTRYPLWVTVNFPVL